MANKKFVVELEGAERERLTALISQGKSSAKVFLKARASCLRLTRVRAAKWPDEKICEALDTNVSMVTRVRARFVDQGLDAVLTRKKRETPPIQPVFDGEAQAKLTALACSAPPAGHARWTIRLLSEQVVERRIVPAAHFNTVGRALKKTNSNRT